MKNLISIENGLFDNDGILFYDYKTKTNFTGIGEQFNIQRYCFQLSPNFHNALYKYIENEFAFSLSVLQSWPLTNNVGSKVTGKKHSLSLSKNGWKILTEEPFYVAQKNGLPSEQDVDDFLKSFMVDFEGCKVVICSDAILPEQLERIVECFAVIHESKCCISNEKLFNFVANNNLALLYMESDHSIRMPTHVLLTPTPLKNIDLFAKSVSVDNIFRDSECVNLWSYF